MSVKPKSNEDQARGEYGMVIESGAIRFERVLPGPIERVRSGAGTTRSGTNLVCPTL
jgi:hypothetical protein